MFDGHEDGQSRDGLLSQQVVGKQLNPHGAKALEPMKAIENQSYNDTKSQPLALYISFFL